MNDHLNCWGKKQQLVVACLMSVMVYLLFSWYHYRDQTCFLCINIPQVLWDVLQIEASDLGFQHLKSGLGFQHLRKNHANVNALKNHIRSLLLHKN